MRSTALHRPGNRSLPLAARVADLVARLTLPEKILQMTRGGAAKNAPTPAIARLGPSRQDTLHSRCFRLSFLVKDNSHSYTHF